MHTQIQSMVGAQVIVAIAVIVRTWLELSCHKSAGTDLKWVLLTGGTEGKGNT